MNTDRTRYDACRDIAQDFSPPTSLDLRQRALRKRQGGTVNTPRWLSEVDFKASEFCQIMSHRHIEGSEARSDTRKHQELTFVTLDSSVTTVVCSLSSANCGGDSAKSHRKQQFLHAKSCSGLQYTTYALDFQIAFLVPPHHPHMHNLVSNSYQPLSHDPTSQSTSHNSSQTQT